MKRRKKPAPLGEPAPLADPLLEALAAKSPELPSSVRIFTPPERDDDDPDRIAGKQFRKRTHERKAELDDRDTRIRAEYRRLMAQQVPPRVGAAHRILGRKFKLSSERIRKITASIK